MSKGFLVRKAADGSAIPGFNDIRDAILFGSTPYSDHEVVSVIVKDEDNREHGIATFNAMRKCSGDSWLVKDEKNPASTKKQRIFKTKAGDRIIPNNPWNFSEHPIKDYRRRLKLQAQNVILTQMKAGEPQETDIFTIQEAGYKGQMAGVLKEILAKPESKTLYGKDLRVIEALPGTKDLIAVYNADKYELVESTPIFKETSASGAETHNAVIYRFKVKATGKFIAVLNKHLSYGKSYEEEMDKIVAEITSDDGSLTQEQLDRLEKLKLEAGDGAADRLAKFEEELKNFNADKKPSLVISCGDNNATMKNGGACFTAPFGATCHDDFKKESRDVADKFSDQGNNYSDQRVKNPNTDEYKTFDSIDIEYFAGDQLEVELVTGRCFSDKAPTASQTVTKEDFCGGYAIFYNGEKRFVKQNDLKSATKKAPAPPPPPPTKTPEPVTATEVAAEAKAIAEIAEEVTKILGAGAAPTAADEKIKTLYQESLKAQKNEPQPKGPYQGIGVKANVKLMQNGKIGAQIASVFSPELQRFKVSTAAGAAAETYIGDPKSLLEGKYITQIVQDGGAVVDIDALAASLGGMKHPNFLKTLVSYFHGEKGNVKITVTDEKGEKPQTIFCERNEKTVFVGSYANDALFSKPAEAFKNTQYNPKTHGVQILTKFKEMLKDQKAKLAAAPAPTPAT